MIEIEAADMLTQRPGNEEDAPAGPASLSDAETRRDAAIADARERFEAIVANVRASLRALKAEAGGGASRLQWMSALDEDGTSPEFEATARALAIAAYNNRENAAWNPLDPSTYRIEADETGFLLRLLATRPSPATTDDAADDSDAADAEVPADVSAAGAAGSEDAASAAPVEQDTFAFFDGTGLRLLI